MGKGDLNHRLRRVERIVTSRTHRPIVLLEPGGTLADSLIRAAREGVEFDASRSIAALPADARTSEEWQQRIGRAREKADCPA